MPSLLIVSIDLRFPSLQEEQNSPSHNQRSIDGVLTRTRQRKACGIDQHVWCAVLSADVSTLSFWSAAVQVINEEVILPGREFTLSKTVLC